MKDLSGRKPSNGLIEFARKYGWEFDGMSHYGHVFNFHKGNIGLAAEKPSEVR